MQKLQITNHSEKNRDHNEVLNQENVSSVYQIHATTVSAIPIKVIECKYIYTHVLQNLYVTAYVPLIDEYTHSRFYIAVHRQVPTRVQINV